MVAFQRSHRVPQIINIKELEKGMKKRYAKFINEYTRKSNDAALFVAQNWAEDKMVKTNGKLTISSENEIQKILDKLRQEK
ncbi:MAG: hypothetical protein ACREBB_04890 [Nitrosotalea sp.]